MNILADKAVLIYPQFDTQDTFWSYAQSLRRYSPAGEFGLPKALLPPLGLMGLYAYLKPYYQSLLLIDRNIDPRPIDSLIADAEHVYIGGMLAQEKNFLALAVAVKKAGKCLIVGGTAISPQSTIAKLADFAVENEAEGVIDELLQDLSNGHKDQYYKGFQVPSEQFFEADYSSINLNNYVHMAVQISRGCPENCQFCDIPSRFGKAYRSTPGGKTEQAFQQMLSLGWKGQVFVVDDNFIANPRKALTVLKDLYLIGEKIGYHHPKYTELTLRIADDSPVMIEVRHWFKKARFINGFYGVETPNKAALLETDKRQNLRGERSLEDKLCYISEQTGAGVMMGMIYGFDHDDNDSVEDFIRFVNATHAPVVMAGLLNALPCTGLMQKMQQQGRLLQSTSGNNSDGVINFIPNHFSVRQAEKNYLRILQGIYQSKSYFTRLMRHLSLIDPGLQSQYRQDNKKFIYLLKILFGKHSHLYWRYLFPALSIAIKRNYRNKAELMSLLAEYFSLCAQYTHFSAQVSAVQRRLARRVYNDNETQSWQQIQQLSAQQVDDG